MDKKKKDKLPTVSIKGKNYVLAKDRIIYFNDNYPKGSIINEIISPIHEGAKLYIVRSTVIPSTEDMSRKFMAHSQAIVGGGGVNATAALENAETSATARALAMMGIGTDESVASAEEVRKAVDPQIQIVSEDVQPKGLADQFSDYLVEEQKKDVHVITDPVIKPLQDETKVKRLFALATEVHKLEGKEYKSEEYKDKVKNYFKVSSFTLLDNRQLDTVIKGLEDRKIKAKEVKA